MDYIKFFVQLLLIIAAINWGLVAYNSKLDVVEILSGGFGTYIKYLVGIAGIYALFYLCC
jgi:uncharacterized membrane protein YuzA (DUF378 family)